MNCGWCNKDVPQTPGRREKKFCGVNCRVYFCKREKKRDLNPITDSEPLNDPHTGMKYEKRPPAGLSLVERIAWIEKHTGKKFNNA